MKQERSGGAYVADGLADEGAVGHELACDRLVVSDRVEKAVTAAVKQRQQQESVPDALAVDAEENGLAAEQ